VTTDTNFTDIESTKALFLKIASNKPNLKAALNDPLVDTMAAFGAHLSVAAHHRADSVERESHLHSAIHRSSVLAKSEDRQYTPRKPRPSIGILKVTDKAAANYDLARDIPLLSGGSVSYLTQDTVKFDPGTSVGYVAVSQIEITSIEEEVVTSSPFHEVILPKEFSPRIAEIFVEVNQAGAGFEPFTLSRRLRNASSDSKVYDEFYTTSDSFGVRFGTGIVGKQLQVGDVVRVTLHLTAGESTLIANEKLKPVGNYPNYDFVVQTTISGGAAQEDLESIRKNSLYYETFDEEHVWGEDYSFFLNGKFPNMTWVSFWGERDQEVMESGLSREFVNKIYVAAYDPQDEIQAAAVQAAIDDGNPLDPSSILPPISDRISAALDAIPQLNKEFVMVPPVTGIFDVQITGTVPRSWDLSSAEKAIEGMLFEKYGQDSKAEKRQPLKRDIYEYLRKLNIFDQDFDVEIILTGTTAIDNKKHFIYLDKSKYVLSGEVILPENKKIILGYS